jgi:sporulation protein YpjB
MLLKTSNTRAFKLILLYMVVFIAMLTGCAEQAKEHTPTIVIPQSQEKPLQLLNHSAKALYDYTKNGEYEEARFELDRFSDLLTAVSYKGIATLDGVNALTQTVINARRIYSRVQLSEKDAMISATQLRLITDALTHPNHPMWLQYEPVLKQDVHNLTSMVKSNNDVGSLAALSKLHEHYSIIHPAALITRQAVIVEKSDSLFKLLTVELSVAKVDYSRVKMGLNQLPIILNELFGSKDSQASVKVEIQNSNVVWTTFIASVIITALAYVAWRRYRGLGA